MSSRAVDPDSYFPFPVSVALVGMRDVRDYLAHVRPDSEPHLVMCAFLQRVVNGGGHIAREMALDSRRLDLCVEYRGFRYAVEVKTSENFKDPDSYAQLADYLDHLGLAEGWMAVFDTDSDKSWEEKIYNREIDFNGKTLHIVGL